MSTIKILPDKECNLYIDQQYVSTIQKGKLYVYDIEPGVYLIELFTEDGGVESFDVELSRDNQQVMKRVSFGSLCEKNIKVIGQSYSDRPILAQETVSGKVKYGYVDASGKAIIPFEYDDATEFEKEGFAIAEKYGFRHVIYKNGLPSFYGSISEAKDDREEIHLLLSNEIVFDDGKRIGVDWLGAAEYNEYIHSWLFTVFSNGSMWIVKTKGDGTFNNEEYTMITQCDKVVSSLIEEYLVIKQGDMLTALPITYPNHEDEILSYRCDKLIPINYRTTEYCEWGGWTTWYHRTKKATFNLFLVERRGKYGVVDVHGTLVRPYIFDDVYYQRINTEKDYSLVGEEFMVVTEGLVGLVDSEFNSIITPRYLEMYSAGNNYCVKCPNSDKYILIDRDNHRLYSEGFSSIIYGGYHEVDAHEYGTVYYGHYDYIIEDSGKKGVLDGEGHLLIPIIYDEIEHILEEEEVQCCPEKGFREDDYFLCKKNGVYGVISPAGDIVLDFEYERIIPISSCVCGCIGGFACKKSGKYALISFDLKHNTGYKYVFDDIIDVDYEFPDIEGVIIISVINKEVVRRIRIKESNWLIIDSDE